LFFCIPARSAIFAPHCLALTLGGGGGGGGGGGRPENCQLLVQETGKICFIKGIMSVAFVCLF
jgi:hypothetical protein